MSNIGFRIFPARRTPRTLTEMFRDLPTPNISDNMNRLFGAGELIRPVHGSAQLLGSAFTVKTRPGDNLIVHKAIDMLEPGDVLVIDAGGETTNAILGEIIMRMVMNRGATGVVVDGTVRDTEAFAEAEFPCFTKGSSHRGPYKDGPGEINVPVVVGRAVVNPGDVVVGDADGLVFVSPEEAEYLAKQTKEKNVQEMETMRQLDDGGVDRSWVDPALEQRGCQWVGFR